MNEQSRRSQRWRRCTYGPMMFVTIVSVLGCFVWYGKLPYYIETNMKSREVMITVTNKVSTLQNKLPISKTTLMKIMNNKNNILDDNETDNDYEEDDEDLVNSRNISNHNYEREKAVSSTEFMLPMSSSSNNIISSSAKKESSSPKFILGKEDDDYISESDKVKREASNGNEAEISDEYFPKLAWLLSFPNSGTSYTMMMVSKSTLTSTATNYGREVTPKHSDVGNDQDIMSSQVHVGQLARPLNILDGTKESEKKTGPFYNALSSKPLAPKYILTKTHCGNRCVDCPPENYHSKFHGFGEFFPNSCTLGSGILEPNGGYEYVSYDMINFVSKAIHLIRNPYHNIIARFHLEVKNTNAKIKSYMESHGSNISQENLDAINAKYTVYNNTKDSFRKYCSDLDGKHKKEVKKVFGEDFYYKYMQKSPCHSEFYKYTNWHNYVHRGLNMYKIPTLIVHYENYEASSNSSKVSQQQQVLNFLDLPKKVEFREFVARHDYDDYFTTKQRKSIAQLIKRVSNPQMLELINHYLEDENSAKETTKRRL